MATLSQITRSIMSDPQNQIFTAQNIPPLFAAPPTARINIVGQAPGIKAQNSRLYWNDQSGDRLREWLGVDRETFYHSGMFAVIPMDFYYPGKGKSGDLPPRVGFAEKWHAPILAQLPNIQLTLLIGQYAQKYYLNLPHTAKLTDTVQNFRQYLPRFFPLVHPSPRNQIWQAKNPWFAQEVIPELRARVQSILNSSCNIKQK